MTQQCLETETKATKMGILDQFETAICLEAILFAVQMQKKYMKLTCLIKVCQVKSSCTKDFD